MNDLNLDSLYPHPDNCGHCETGRLLHKHVLPVTSDPNHTEKQLSDAVKAMDKAWKETKYYKLYQKCLAKGISPDAEFKKRGWEM